MLINLAILKYNLENFSLDIIEYCSPKLKENNIIQILINLFTTFLKQLVLLQVTFIMRLVEMSSRIVSEATLNKMKQRKQSEQTKDKIRKAIGILVKVIDIDKEEITIYASKKEAGLHLSTNDTTIGRYIRSGKLLFNKYLITEVD